MERRKFVQGAGMAGILAAGVAPAVHAQQSIRWRIVSSFPKSLDTLFGTAETFAKMVTAASGGRLTVSAHPAGELVPAFGVLDAVKDGTVECCNTAAYYFVGKDPVFGIDCAIPFGLNSRQMTAWYYHGNGLTLMREFYRQYNVVNFALGNTSAQMGGWFRKEIKDLDDLKGLKFRMGSFAGRVLQRLGVVPQNIPAGEIYQALEKGTIDAAEWVGPYDDLKLGLDKVAKYYYYPGWWEGSAQGSLYVNQKAWDALPADLKAIVEAVAGYAHTDQLAKYDAKNPAALKELAARGAKLTAFPKAVMEAAYKEAQGVYTELNDTNPTWKKIYADYSKFRADEVLWFRFAEAGFDSFMQAQKL
jgi:TRAP-type mannitol/chloroaromatic compound transport system substrate-binding protein